MRHIFTYVRELLPVRAVRLALSGVSRSTEPTMRGPSVGSGLDRLPTLETDPPERSSSNARAIQPDAPLRCENRPGPHPSFYGKSLIRTPAQTEDETDG